MDVLGISLSTLLFTIVWVSLFSIFLPETSDVVFSEGFKNLSAKVSTEESIDPLGKVLGVSTVDVVKTGGSVVGVAGVLNLDGVFRPLVSGANVFTIGQGVLYYTSEYLDFMTLGSYSDLSSPALKHSLSYSVSF